MPIDPHVELFMVQLKIRLDGLGPLDKQGYGRIFRQGRNIRQAFQVGHGQGGKGKLVFAAQV